MESYAAGETTPPLVERTIGADFEAAVASYPDHEALVEYATGRRWTYAELDRDVDAFARGLKIAHAIREDGRLAAFVKDRYASWDSDLGRKVESGKATFADLEAHALKSDDVTTVSSGRQEMLENLINEFI